MADVRVLSESDKRSLGIDVGVTNAKMDRRRRRSKVREYEDRARREGKPFCNRCFILDYPNVKTFDFYTDMKMVEEQVEKEKDPRRANFGKPIGIHRNYICNRNNRHAHSLWVYAHELEEDYFEKHKTRFKRKGVKKKASK
jgi:hypothetical protein